MPHRHRAGSLHINTELVVFTPHNSDLLDKPAAFALRQTTGQRINDAPLTSLRSSVEKLGYDLCGDSKAPSVPCMRVSISMTSQQ